MHSTIEGSLVANDSRIAIVVSRFNSFITERLVEGAIDTWRRHGGDDSETVPYTQLPPPSNKEA